MEERLVCFFSDGSHWAPLYTSQGQPRKKRDFPELVYRSAFFRGLSQADRLFLRPRSSTR